MIHKVTIDFGQLMNDALSIVSGFAILEDVVYAEVAILYKFAILFVDHIRETEYFSVVGLDHIHYLVLVRIEILIEKNESSLIIKMSFIDDLD